MMNDARQQMTVGEVIELLRLYHPNDRLMMSGPAHWNLAVVGLNEQKTTELGVPCLQVDFISRDSAGIETETDILNRKVRDLEGEARAIKREIKKREAKPKAAPKKKNTKRKRTKKDETE